MKISIITVCYNSENTIRDTIESVLSQSYSDIEYIIIDGGSTDGTISIIDEYRDNIDIIVSEKDNGIYDAMNKGILLSKGDIVGIINSDDFFSDVNVIKDVSDLFCEGGIDGLYGDLIYVNRENVEKKVRNYSSRFFSKWQIRFGMMLPHPTLYLKRKIFSDVGSYKLDYRVAADFEFITRLFVTGITLKRLPRIMVKMREGGISSTGVWWRIHQNLEIVRACRENGLYTNIVMVSAKVPFKLLSYLAG